MFNTFAAWLCYMLEYEEIWKKKWNSVPGIKLFYCYIINVIFKGVFQEIYWEKTVERNCDLLENRLLLKYKILIAHTGRTIYFLPTTHVRCTRVYNTITIYKYSMLFMLVRGCILHLGCLDGGNMLTIKLNKLSHPCARALTYWPTLSKNTELYL